MILKGAVVFISFIIIGIAISGCTFANTCKLSTSTVQIASISDNIGVHGSFALGFGTVDSYPAYYFYEGNEQSGYQLKSIPAKNTIIYKDENNFPYITDTYDTCNRYDDHYYTVHVPSDAITRDYHLNGV